MAGLGASFIHDLIDGKDQEQQAQNENEGKRKGEKYHRRNLCPCPVLDIPSPYDESS
jgi:hypothetical protein